LSLKIEKEEMDHLHSIIIKHDLFGIEIRKLLRRKKVKGINKKELEKISQKHNNLVTEDLKKIIAENTSNEIDKIKVQSLLEKYQRNLDSNKEYKNSVREFYNCCYDIAKHQVYKKHYNYEKREDVIQFVVSKCFDHINSYKKEKNSSTYAFFWRQIQFSIKYYDRREAKEKTKIDYVTQANDCLSDNKKKRKKRMRTETRVDVFNAGENIMDIPFVSKDCNESDFFGKEYFQLNNNSSVFIPYDEIKTLKRILEEHFKEFLEDSDLENVTFTKKNVKKLLLLCHKKNPHILNEFNELRPTIKKIIDGQRMKVRGF
jgi:hypothetical protein